jgi:hypothetical protein
LDNVTLICTLEFSVPGLRGVMVEVGNQYDQAAYSANLVRLPMPCPIPLWPPTARGGACGACGCGRVGRRESHRWRSLATVIACVLDRLAWLGAVSLMNLAHRWTRAGRCCKRPSLPMRSAPTRASSRSASRALKTSVKCEPRHRARPCAAAPILRTRSAPVQLNTYHSAVCA